MAMRLYKQNEFEEELRKLGLKPTEEKTDDYRIWVDRDGNALSVPVYNDMYPDYIIDRLLEKAGNLYHKGDLGGDAVISFNPKD